MPVGVVKLAAAKRGPRGRLYVVDGGWGASMRYVFAEVAQLIEH